MRLLTIRLKQCKREIDALGVVRLLFLIAIFIYLIYFSNRLHQDATSSIYQFLCLLVASLGVHFSRKDKNFVKLNIRKPHFEIYLEYFFLTIPFSISSLVQPHWYLFFIFQLLLVLIPFIRFTFRISNVKYNFFTKFIEPSAYEYLSGVRHVFIYLAPLYVLTLFFSWFKILPLFLLWIIGGVIFTTCYVECEPFNVLRSTHMTPKHFLFNKILNHSKYLSFIYLPIILINTFFNPEYWFINLLFLLAQYSLLFFSIALKYSSYYPNENLKRNNTIMSMVLLGVLFPFFLPLPLLMTPFFYYKATKKLSQFL